MTTLQTTEFCNKKQLYQKIELLRNLLDIKLYQYPINIFSVINKLNDYIDFIFQEFESKKFKAILLRSKIQKSKIIINTNLSEKELGFALAHEIIHFFCHYKKLIYNFDGKESNIIEWQANAGASELLMPYQTFIPDWFRTLTYYNDFEYAKQQMATAWCVTPTMIDYRLNSLLYEIEQYKNNTPINEIKVLSRTKYLNQLHEQKALYFLINR